MFSTPEKHMKFLNKIEKEIIKNQNDKIQQEITDKQNEEKTNMLIKEAVKAHNKCGDSKASLRNL